MSQGRLIENAFEDIAQSLRIFLEADFRANHKGLLFADRAEAVGNIETALSSVLNAFHRLYDAIRKQLGNDPIDWYRTGSLATILAIRNARHHNIANCIRTLYTYHTQEAERLDRMVQYVYVDFPLPDKDADTFDVYMSWADLRQLLSLPKSESKIRSDTGTVIRHYLSSEKFSGYASYYELSESRVFFNIVPLFVNAAAKIVPAIKSHLRGTSTESKFFAYHFSTVENVDTKNHEVNCGPFVLPK